MLQTSLNERDVREHLAFSIYTKILAYDYRIVKHFLPLAAAGATSGWL